MVYNYFLGSTRIVNFVKEPECVKFILNDGAVYTLKQPTFGSMLGLRSTYNTWLPEVQEVFPSSNASKLQQVIINDSEITQVRSYGFYSISNLKTVEDKKGTVTSIGASAFYRCSSLTTASFPVCMSISYNAFADCSSLTTASFPACASIGTYAFAYCSSLTTASFPICTSIGASAFYRCFSLTTASFPVCTSISSYAFYNCSSLTTASFPACTSIGSSAFGFCSSLTTASFPACTSIGSGAFYYCSSLTTASFPACTSIGTYAFGFCSSLTTASFPACTSIGTYAFDTCSSLTTASFPVCMTISSWAFQYCSSLTSLYLTGYQFDSSVVSIQTNAINKQGVDVYVGSSWYSNFVNDTNWKTLINSGSVNLISVAKPKTTTLTLTYSDNTTSTIATEEVVTYFDLGKATYSSPNTSVKTVLSEDITEIGYCAFFKCSSLTAASFPACTSIGGYAFGFCSSLTTASFHACKTIGPWAFCSCSSLTAASFPVCTSIDSMAFAYCSSLTTASFPVCTSIGAYAFASCKALENIYFLGSSVPNLPYSNAFDSLPTTYNIYVQSSMLTTFQTANQWSTISSHIVVYSYDLQYASIKQPNIQKYTGQPVIPNIAVKQNGIYLVKDQDYIIEYSNNIEIGTASFIITGIGKYYGTRQGTFDIDNIKQTVFKISTVSSAPNNKFGIYQAAKHNDAESINIDWGDGQSEELTAISNKIHTYTNPGEYDVIIDDSISSITGTTTANNYECNYQIIDVEFGDKLSVLGNYAFYYANQLTSIDLSNCNIVSVGNYAYRYCSNVKDIYIGSQLTALGTAPFDIRNNIDNIYVDAANPNYSYENGILKSNTGILYNVDCNFNGAIPSDITSIQIYGLAYTNLTSIDILSSVTSFTGGYSLAYNENLLCTHIAANTTTLQTYTFRYDSALQYVKIDSNLTAIASGTFGNCSSLKVIDFSGRTTTTIPTIPTATTTIGVFNNTPDGIKVIVPDSLYSNWIANTNWNTWITREKIKIIKASEFTGYQLS